MDDLAVLASLGASAWALYSLGYRVRSRVVAVVLMSLPPVVWLACTVWLYGVVAEAGLHPLLGGVPAVAAHLGVVLIVVRRVGGLSYRLDAQDDFVRDLRAADRAIRDAYLQEPVLSADGLVAVEPLRQRLEDALRQFEALQPPPGEWTRRVEERLELHRAYIELLLSPVPLGPEVIEPLQRRTRDWVEEADRMVGGDNARG